MTPEEKQQAVVWARDRIAIEEIARDPVTTFEKLKRLEAALAHQERILAEEKATGMGAVDRWCGMQNVIDAVRKALCPS